MRIRPGDPSSASVPAPVAVTSAAGYSRTPTCLRRSLLRVGHVVDEAEMAPGAGLEPKGAGRPGAGPMPGGKAEVAGRRFRLSLRWVIPADPVDGESTK
jgi:hypothetical protein